MLKDFKEFILRGNVVDLAVGFIVGAAFTALVKSLVTNVLMPPLGLLVGNAQFHDQFLVLKQGSPGAPYPSLEAAQAAGASTLNYGLFLDELVAFLIVAWVVFLIVRAINRLERRRQGVPTSEAPTTKRCPWCQSEVPLAAVRCPFCTSSLEEGPAGA